MAPTGLAVSSKAIRIAWIAREQLRGCSFTAFLAYCSRAASTRGILFVCVAMTEQLAGELWLLLQAVTWHAVARVSSQS